MSDRGLEMHYLFEFPLSFLRYQIILTVNCSVHPSQNSYMLFLLVLDAFSNNSQNGEKIQRRVFEMLLLSFHSYSIR